MSQNPEAKALLAARRSAAKELALPVTDWRVRRFGLLMAAHDALTARAAAGEHYKIEDLLRLDSAMQEIRGSIPNEHTIKIEYAEGVCGIYRCSKCGTQNRLAEGEYTPISSDKTTQDTLPAVRQPPTTEGHQATISRAVGHVQKGTEQRPYHQTHAKDSRPNAAPSLADGGASVVWSNSLSKSRRAYEKAIRARRAARRPGRC
jgi:hypothetical protein